MLTTFFFSYIIPENTKFVSRKNSIYTLILPLKLYLSIAKEKNFHKMLKILTGKRKKQRKFT